MSAVLSTARPRRGLPPASRQSTAFKLKVGRIVATLLMAAVVLHGCATQRDVVRTRVVGVGVAVVGVGTFLTGLLVSATCAPPQSEFSSGCAGLGGFPIVAGSVMTIAGAGVVAGTLIEPDDSEGSAAAPLPANVARALEHQRQELRAAAAEFCTPAKLNCHLVTRCLLDRDPYACGAADTRVAFVPSLLTTWQRLRTESLALARNEQNPSRVRTPSQRPWSALDD